MAPERRHRIGVLSLANEFREDFIFWRSQEKIGERIAQCRRGDEFGGGNTRSNGPEPRAERVPDQLWINGTEVLEKTLGDDAGEDENVVSAHLSLNGIAVFF